MVQIEFRFPAAVVYEKRVAIMLEPEEFNELRGKYKTHTLISFGKTLSELLSPKPMLVLDDKNDMYIAVVDDGSRHDFFSSISEAERIVTDLLYIPQGKSKGHYKLIPQYFAGKAINNEREMLGWIREVERERGIKGLCLNPVVKGVYSWGVEFSGNYASFKTVKRDLKRSLMIQASLN